MIDQAIEHEIQAKGNTAPRITPADVEANIVASFYFTALDGVEESTGSWDANGFSYALGLVTFCVLILKNGTKIVGINYGPVCPGNFDADIGRKEARAHAIEQIWPLMGYALRSNLSSAA